MPSVFGCVSSGSRYGNVTNELIHRAGPPFLDNHYRGYQLGVSNQWTGLDWTGILECPNLPLLRMRVVFSPRGQCSHNNRTQRIV